MQNKQERFQEIVNTYQDVVYRLCRGYYPNSQDVDDLYQEIWIKIWMKLEQFRGEANIGTWIYRIATNTAISHKRREKQQQHLFFNNEITKPIAADSTSLEEKQRQEEQLQQLYQAIHQLPEMDRIIITMVLENTPYQTIAEVTGLTLNYVGVKINRIKASIKKMLVTKPI